MPGTRRRARPQTPLTVAASGQPGPLTVTLTNDASTTAAAPSAGENTFFSMPSLTGIAASGGAAKATTSPAPASASCLAANQQKVVVTWSAVSHAATYTVYKSATLAGSYTSTATGLTTPTWTSGSLAAGNVYFKVAAYFGTKWIGTQSVATGESTIATNSCVQP